METEASAAAGDMQSASLALSGVLDVTVAEDLLARCRAAAASGDGPVEVDAGAVEGVDTAALQVLLALARALADQGRALRWRAVSPALAEAAALAGAEAILGIGGGPDAGGGNADTGEGSGEGNVSAPEPRGRSGSAGPG